MRRRYMFPAILLGACGLWATVGAFASAPPQSHDYLNALVIDENYALGTQWRDADISHAEKLTADHETLFIRLIERFDELTPVPSDRKLFLGQADAAFQVRDCGPEECQFNVRLNRVVEPEFVHGDLRLVQLKETSIRQAITASGDNIVLGAKTEDTRQFRFMLTERGWVLKSVETIASNAHQLSHADALETEKMSGLNYYPHTAPWDDFWAEFPIAEIEQDLDTVSALGANAVRIFLQYEYFANLETREDGLSKLSQFLDMCADRDIKVIVTLFDLRGDYRLQNWSRDSIHIATILETIHKHEALLAVDLKNQPDLDFAPSGEEQVTAWLEAMIASVRQNHPDLPLTIGWSDPSHAHRLSGQVNLVSFHDYNNADGLSSRLAGIKAKIGDKPVFATEIGHSRWSLTGDKSVRQADRLKAQLNQLDRADGVFVWTLHDFDEIGSHIVGHRPWRKAQQKAYGITTQQGDWRPAAKAFYEFNQTFHSIPQGD